MGSKRLPSCPVVSGLVFLSCPVLFYGPQLQLRLWSQKLNISDVVLALAPYWNDSVQDLMDRERKNAQK